jgi:hypothetical protein
MVLSSESQLWLLENDSCMGGSLHASPEGCDEQDMLPSERCERRQLEFTTE